MKRFTALIIIIAMLVTSACAEFFLAFGTIEAVDYTTDTFKIMLEDGNIFEMTEVEDWFILDKVVVLINDFGQSDPTCWRIEHIMWTGENEMYD